MRLRLAAALCLALASTTPARLHSQTSATLPVLVRDDRGPVAGALVVADGGTRAVTKADGIATLLLSAGEHALRVTAVGRLPVEQIVRVQATGMATVTITMVLRASQLDDVVASGAREKYRAATPSPSLRIETPFLETPQNIQTITQDLVRDQQVFNLNEVSRNISGVNTTFPYPTLATDFTIRGTYAANNLFRNGLLTPQYALQTDPALIERLEFVKGPAGFMLSQGEPGGLLNVVTKQPTAQSIRSLNLSVGSFNAYRANIDLGGKLTDDGRLTFRFNAGLYRSDLAIRNEYNHRYFVAPAVRFAIDSRTSISAEYNATWAQTRVGGSVVPTEGPDYRFFTLARDFGLDEPTMPPLHLHDNYVRVALEHQLSSTWRFSAVVGDHGSQWLGYQGFIRSPVDFNNLDSAGVPRRASFDDYRERNLLGQFFLNGSAITGSVKHRFLVGLDAGDVQSSYVYVQVNPPNLNPRNPTYTVPASFYPPVDSDTIPATRSGNRWAAGYIQDDITLKPWLLLTAAVRFTSYRSTAEPDSAEHTSKLSPRGGVTLRPTRNVSIYALYDQSFIAQSGRDFAGNRFQPLEGNNMEVGVKSEWLGGRLGTTFAAFDIHKTNALTADPQNPGFSIARGEIESRGIEVDILGSLGRGTSITANYAYTDAKVTRDSDPANIGLGQFGTARHAANLWLRHEGFGAALKRLGLAGGIVYLGSRDPGAATLADEANRVPGYVRFDAGVTYRVKRYRANVYVENLANRRYVAFGYFSRNDTSAGYVYNEGAPRNVRISLDVPL